MRLKSISATASLIAVAGVLMGATIQSGTILYSSGHYLASTPIKVGYDPFGYNYQAHMFSSSYANAYLGAAGYPPYTGDDGSYLAANPGVATHWAWPYRNVTLTMKWNDAWLSNEDRDDDHVLDRHHAFAAYRGSGAWLTNHMSGSYEQDGKTQHWNYFVKIVAAPSDATLTGGVWYGADNKEIGPVIWGEFAILQEISNDTGTGDHGALYRSPAGPGFGKY